jgi:hypothetical protein
MLIYLVRLARHSLACPQAHCLPLPSLPALIVYLPPLSFLSPTSERTGFASVYGTEQQGDGSEGIEGDEEFRRRRKLHLRCIARFHVWSHGPTRQSQGLYI